MSNTAIHKTLEFTSSKSNSIFSLISTSDSISKILIFILLIISILAWTVIIEKILYLSKIKRKINNFERIFWSGSSFDQLYDTIKRSVDNPLAGVFIAAMNECKRTNSKELTDHLKNSHKTRIIQSMFLIRNRESEKLEKNLNFLATTSSTAPFIGLFGTVWGIMNSFQAIALSQNNSLSVVAPGIAEALLATAIGMLAAIPALIFYNFLSTQINKINNKIDDFITEIYSLLTRAIDEEKL